METDRRGSEDSSCSTTTSTISNFSRLQASYNREDWTRLRDTWSAIRASRLSLLELSSRLEEAISEQSNYRDYASKIQNREIHLKLHRNRLLLARQRIRAVQSRLEHAVQEEFKKEKEREELERKVECMGIDIPQTSQQIETLKLTLATLQNELLFRRRYMINELWRIFFPCVADNQECNGEHLQQTSRKSRCDCGIYDSIRGNHLRINNFRMEHSDIELSACAAHLINLLDCFLRILNLPSKHLLNFNGSKSCLLHRDTLDVYNFFPGIKQRRKKPRGHLATPMAYYLDESLPKLAEVVVHLRTECGLVTTERDRPVKNFVEVMLFCLGRKLSWTDPEDPFIRQVNPFSSASSAIFRVNSIPSADWDYKEENSIKNGCMTNMEKKFMKGLTINCEESNSLLSILEVISPTWSPMKLAAEDATMRKTGPSKKDAVANYPLAIHQSPSSAKPKYIPSV